MVKIYIFELTQSICDKDKSFLLSELDSSEIKMLPKQGGKNFELSLIGKVLTKRIVSSETLTPKKNVLIGKTKLGKPIIKKPGNLNLDISISHSGNYLVIGIFNSGKIGVDIELLKDIDFGVFRNCLSASEEIYINSGKKMKQRLENFYEIWTRKEAYLKALGIGLQKPLPITQFYPDRNKPKAEIGHNNQQFYFLTLKEDKFILSVCTTRSTAYDQSYTKLTLDKLWSFVTDRKMTRSNV
jgi:4'-phosphopantetheinyl transferase